MACTISRTSVSAPTYIPIVDWLVLGLCGRFPVPGVCGYGWRFDLRQTNLALLRKHAPVIPEVVDHQSVSAEQGKEPLPVVAHNGQRSAAIVGDVARGIKRHLWNIVFDKRGQENLPAISSNAAQLRYVNLHVLGRHIREHAPHVDDVR